MGILFNLIQKLRKNTIKEAPKDPVHIPKMLPAVIADTPITIIEEVMNYEKAKAEEEFLESQLGQKVTCMIPKKTHVTPEIMPNNWRRMHGYPMRRRNHRRASRRMA